MITDYASLQTEIAGELNRDDLTTAITGFIQRAENALRRNTSVRRRASASLPVASGASVVSLPTDVQRIETLEHTGPTYFGDLDLVGFGDIGKIRGERQGAAGVPIVYAPIGSPGSLQIRLAPIPDAAYTLSMSYWATIPSLSSTVSTNWLLQSDPDIYFYAALVESAPYLKEDERIVVWKTELADRLNQLNRFNSQLEVSGNAVFRPSMVIGG